MSDKINRKKIWSTSHSIVTLSALLKFTQKHVLFSWMFFYKFFHTYRYSLKKEFNERSHCLHFSNLLRNMFFSHGLSFTSFFTIISIHSKRIQRTFRNVSRTHFWYVLDTLIQKRPGTLQRILPRSFSLPNPRPIKLFPNGFTHTTCTDVPT